MAYPATFDVQSPQQFDKAQVALRIVIILVLAFIQVGSIVFGGAYLIFPVLAAILIAQKGSQQYLTDAPANTLKWLRYLLMFYSYMALATDKLATQNPEQIVKLEVTTSGTPTVGNALLRIILGLPHAIVLGFVGIAFAVVWLISAISILIGGSRPEWADGFIRGYLRWNARVLAYMASLVDEYPPFSFSDGPAEAGPQPEPPTLPPPAQASQ
jgi:hypothetical protein